MTSDREEQTNLDEVPAREKLRQRLWVFTVLMLLLAVVTAGLWFSHLGPEFDSVRARYEAAVAVEEAPDDFRELLATDRFRADPEAVLVAEVSASAFDASMALVEMRFGEPVRESEAVTYSEVRIVLRGSSAAASRVLEDLLGMGPHLRVSSVGLDSPGEGPLRLTVEGRFRRVDLAAGS